MAVVGVADNLKGQVGVAFAIAKGGTGVVDAGAHSKLKAEVIKVVSQSIGTVGRPARVYFVTVLANTRSGKLLRRAIQAVCKGRDPGELTPMEDPSAFHQFKAMG